VLLCDRHDRIHVAGQVEHVHGHDGTCVRRDLPLDVSGINGEALVDVDQPGTAPTITGAAAVAIQV
jgi:hypothetical protein